MDMETIYGQLGLDAIATEIEALFPKWDISFQKLFFEIVSGNGSDAFMEKVKEIAYMITAELDAVKFICVTLLLIGILSTVFSNFSSIFPGQQIGEFGFQFTYLILIIFLLKVNSEIFLVARKGIDGMVSFLQVFLPTYFVAVGTAGGSATAFGFYQVFLIGVYFVEQILIVWILPFISCYMLLCIINGIWEEERLGIFLNLVKGSIQTFLKLLLTVAVGSGVFQSMITPVIDTAKWNTVKKSVEVLPGVGELADGSIQVVLGMSVLVKNTMGVIFMILILLVCAIPIVKVFLFMLVIKGSAGLMGLSADKRIINCTNNFGDGIMLLLQTILTAVLFFLILVILVTFSANRGFI